MGWQVLVVGAGGVLGEALCREFAADGRVTALRRPGSPPVAVPGVRTVNETLEDGDALRNALDAADPQGAGFDLVIHNAAQLCVAPFTALRLTDFEAVWHATVATAVASVQAVLPGMLQRQQGCLLFCGATASLRGGAGFSAFASAKFALRGLAQSLARECHPNGVHVVHLVLDGLLAGSASAARFAAGRGASDGTLLAPDAVARACRAIAAQDRSAWTHEIDLRPAQERF